MPYSAQKKDFPQWRAGEPLEEAIQNVWHYCTASDVDKAEALECLTHHFEPMVRMFAYIKIGKIPANMEPDDLVQEGGIAVWDFFAGKLKIPEEATPIKLYTTICSYLGVRIRGSFDDYLRREGLQIGYSSRGAGWLHNGFVPVDSESESLLDVPDLHGQSLDARRELQRVEKAIRAMPPILRIVLSGMVMGYSNSEISKEIARKKLKGRVVCSASRISQLSREAQSAFMEQLRLAGGCSPYDTRDGDTLPTLRGTKMKPYSAPHGRVNEIGAASPSLG